MTKENKKSIGLVTVDQIQSYLKKKNWINDSVVRDVATIWHRNDNYDAEVILPISRSIKDFDERLLDAVNSIAKYEERDSEDIIGDVLNLFSSIVTVRVIGADTRDGTIPINDGVLLISKAKDMLMSAAMAMFAKRRLFTGKPPKDAASYIESLLLGQTEVGSYIVNVLVPQEEASVQRQVDGAEPVEGVALSLAHGLEALARAREDFEKTKDVTVFDNAVRLGVSANLCDALMGFSGEEHKRDFEIRISGAAGPWFDGETKVFPFDPDDVKALKIASGYFKDDYVLSSRRIVGFVRKLHRDKGSDVGKVAVEATLHESTRSIQIELDPKEYHDAVTAHDKQLWVECYGDIYVKGRVTKLQNHTGFRILDAGVLF